MSSFLFRMAVTFVASDLATGANCLANTFKTIASERIDKSSINPFGDSWTILDHIRIDLHKRCAGTILRVGMFGREDSIGTIYLQATAPRSGQTAADRKTIVRHSR